jgi:hypothetical protein
MEYVYQTGAASAIAVAARIFRYAICMFRARNRALLLLLLFCFAPYVPADSTIVTKTAVDGRESVVREYRQARNFRTEDMPSSGSPRSVMIFNFDRRAMYRLDEQARQYSEMQRPDILAILAAWMARSPRIKESGKTVNIYQETIDTGERRQMFGRTARHLLLRERHIGEDGACAPNFEVEKNGWYFAASYAGPAPATFTLTFVYQCLDRVVKHGSPVSPGFPIQETTTTTYSNPAFSSSVTREVIAFSTDPLDKALFEIPEGFKRIEDVSWTRRLESDWYQLAQAASSWFE